MTPDQLRQLIADSETCGYCILEPSQAIELTAHVGDLEALLERVQALEGALRPFAEFADKWTAKPLPRVDDAFYGIHAGTEWAAELRLSDCQKAREVLDKYNPTTEAQA